MKCRSVYSQCGGNIEFSCRAGAAVHRLRGMGIEKHGRDTDIAFQFDWEAN